MKIKLGKGKGILLLIVISLMPFSLYSQELTNKEIREKMNEAQAFFNDKKYDEAIKILTEIVDKNPERLDQAVELMEKITEIRNQYNDLYKELIEALYEDEDPAKALEIIALMEELEPNPNEVNDQAITNARIAAELVYNKIALREIMDRAKIQLDLKNYEEALLIYETGFELGRQTFEESEMVSDLDKNAVERVIDEIYESALLYIRDERDLQQQVSTLQNQMISISSGSLSGQLDNIIAQLSSLSEIREEFIEKSSIIIENLKIITAINDKAPERYFLDFSNFLIFGHPDSDFFEGIISTTDLFWEDRFAALTNSVDNLMIRSYNTSLNNYRNGNLSVVSSGFQDILNYAQSSIKLYDLIHERITIGQYLELDDYSSHLAETYYGKLVDARVFARSTSSFGKMIAQREGFSDYSLEGELDINSLYSMRQSITEDLPVIDEELELWDTIGSSLDWLQPYAALPDQSPSVNVAVKRELNDLKDEMKGINLAILTRLTDQEYARIVSSLSQYRDSYGDNNTLIEGIVDPEVAAYTGDEELISTYPDRALPGLVELGSDIGALIAGTEEIINTFTLGDAEGSEDEKIRGFLDKLDVLIPQINGLSAEVETLEILARDNIFKADGFEDQGDKLLSTVRTIVASPRATRESFDRARESIKDANNAYYQSLSFKENLDLRRRADEEMAALQQALIDGENKLVVQDVRNYINQGKQAYVNRQYSRAGVFLDRALSRWQTTNTDDHPEIQYWKALVDLALQFDRGRTIRPTEPLYEEMTQFLNLAFSNFNKGVNLLSRGERDAGVAALNQAISNIENVEIHMPRNETASLLRLKIAQLIDPEQFRASFSERIDKAMEKLRSSNNSTQGEGYNELVDLSKIDADYPGLQAKITLAEYDILKIKVRPPSRKAVAESVKLYNQAYDIVQTGIRANYDSALILLNEAISKNPENSEAIALKDRVQADTGGQITLVQSTAVENKIRDVQALLEQREDLKAFIKLQELLQNPDSAADPRVKKLEEELKKRGYTADN